MTIQNSAFNPPTITVHAGEEVRWTNQDGFQHTVTSNAGDPASFDSGGLGQGMQFTFTFGKVGNYAYHCSIHPTMAGTVAVQA